VFDTSHLEWPPPDVVPPEEVIDCLVEDSAGVADPVRWSEYLPDGLLADMLAQPGQVGVEHREFEALERVGAWERVIAWAQARQLREMTSFVERAEARNRALGACDSQAQDAAVAEVGLMLRVSARTAAGRVNDAYSLCTRLPATLAALEAGRITLAKARIIDAETMNLSPEHTAAVEEQALVKARRQTPGQLRAGTRRAVLSADPTAAQERGEQARRERGVQIWPESRVVHTSRSDLARRGLTGGVREGGAPSSHSELCRCVLEGWCLLARGRRFCRGRGLTASGVEGGLYLDRPLGNGP
jgi:hypothetical protein